MYSQIGETRFAPRGGDEDGGSLAADLTLRVEKLVTGGDGLARAGGKVAFVPYVLPGELVEASPVEERKDFLRMSIPKVLEPSEDRVLPPCPVFGTCGGCTLQHIRYERQLALKEEIVRETFRRTGRLELPAFGSEPSPAYAYRNRVQLHRTETGRLGYRMARSEGIVPIDACPVAAGEINTFLAAWNGGERPEGITGDRITLFGADGRLAAAGRDSRAEAVLLGRTIRFSPGGFFQSNLAVLRSLLENTLAGRAGDLALDLYAGVGLFSAFLADSFRRVIAVEQEKRSLAFVKENTGGRSGVRAFAMPVERWVAGRDAPRGADLVLVDPPRSGLGSRVRKYLLGGRFPTVVYVSCDPVTQARDVAELLQGDYRIESFRLYDFYPQTAHIETVCILSRK